LSVFSLQFSVRKREERLAFVDGFQLLIQERKNTLRAVRAAKEEKIQWMAERERRCGRGKC
jgi:hypothetical protein